MAIRVTPGKGQNGQHGSDGLKGKDGIHGNDIEVQGKCKPGCHTCGEISGNKNFFIIFSCCFVVIFDTNVLI